VIERLPPAYLARVAAPAGEGDLVPADLAGEAGTLVVGDGVRVMLRLAKDPSPPRRIAAARFRALGSPAPRAPGSVLVERLVGLDVDEARRLTVDDLLCGLGDVPPAVSRAAARLLEALARALDDGRAAAHVGAPGVLACRCLSVGDREVRRAIRGGARDVPAIGAACAAGTGCQSCWPDLRTILDEERPRDDPPDPRAAAATPEAAVAGVVGPLWRAQGVRLGAIEVEGRVVRLGVERLEPASFASPFGALALARHALRDVLCEDVRVEALDAPTSPGRGQDGAPA
jgi:bacterioferritin-associated ferredoxin/NifU-like protein involved in Fe-S cluster formation